MNASPCGEVTLRSFKCYLLHQNLFNKNDLLTLIQNLKRLNQIYASGELFVPLEKYPFIQKNHSFFKYPPVLLQLALNALSLPQMELSINGAISKMQKQALLDEAIGASFPIHHGLGLSEKLIAFLCSSFWHSYPGKYIEGTVVINQGALSTSLLDHFLRAHPPLEAFSNSKLRPGAFSIKQYIEGVMLSVATNFNRVNQSILLFILRSLRGSLSVHSNHYPLLHKDASLQIIAEEEHNRPDSTKSPYSTSRAPSVYNSSTQRSYNTERRVSSRYEPRGGSPDKRGTSSPLITKYQEKQKPPPAVRKKTPVRTLVIPGLSPRGKEGLKTESTIVTSSINLQRRMPSPKKVSSSIPSFQISLPPPPPELKEKANAVLKTLRTSQPQSARLPMGNSRSRVS